MDVRRALPAGTAGDARELLLAAQSPDGGADAETGERGVSGVWVVAQGSPDAIAATFVVAVRHAGQHADPGANPCPDAEAASTFPRERGRRWHASCFLYLRDAALWGGTCRRILRRVVLVVKSVEERLTTVEHKVEENARRIDGLHEAIRDLGDRMERRFDAIDKRFEAIDRRFDAIDRRFETIDRRFETTDRRFLWLVGFQMTTLIAIFGAIAAALGG